MREKPYYSVRTGKNPLSGSIDLPSLIKLFKTNYIYFEKEGYFQQDFGFECVDSGFNPGTLGHDIEGALLLELRKNNLYPIDTQLDNYTEDDLFDIIEFLMTIALNQLNAHITIGASVVGTVRHSSENLVKPSIAKK